MTPTKQTKHRFNPIPEDLQPQLVREVARYRVGLIRETADSEPPPRCSNPQALADWVLAELADRPQEHMLAVYLDTRNRVIGWTVADVGTMNRAAVEPRTILQTGLLLNAAGVAIAHNHPSGDPSPSAEDLSFTRRMAEAGEIVGVRLVDHLVIGDGNWVSLRQRGAL